MGKAAGDHRWERPTAAAGIGEDARPAAGDCALDGMAEGQSRSSAAEAMGEGVGGSGSKGRMLGKADYRDWELRRVVENEVSGMESCSRGLEGGHRCGMLVVLAAG